MSRLRKPSYVETIALAFVLIAIVLTALWGGGVFKRLDWNPDVWAASLICNLFTTGLTIYFVNSVLVIRDNRQRDQAIGPVPKLVWLEAYAHTFLLASDLVVDPSAGIKALEARSKELKRFAESIQQSLADYGGVFDYALISNLKHMADNVEALSLFTHSDNQQDDLTRVHMHLRHVLDAYEYLRERFPVKAAPKAEILFEGPAEAIAASEQKYNIKYPDLAGRKAKTDE